MQKPTQLLLSAVFGMLASLPSLTGGIAYAKPSDKQDQVLPKADINGIGQYKIGMKLDDFISQNEIISNKGYIDTLGRSKLALSSGVHEIVGQLKKYEYSGDYSIAGNFDPKAREFIIRNYSVAGMTIDLDLIFYEGNLVYVKSEDHSLRRAFLEKYGNGKKEERKRAKKCRDPKGFSRDVEERNVNNKWGNGEIYAESNTGEFQLTTCGEYLDMTYTTVKNTKKYEEYTIRNKSFSDGKLNSAKKQNGDTLDDL